MHIKTEFAQVLVGSYPSLVHTCIVFMNVSSTAFSQILFRFAALLAHATRAGRSASLHCSPMRPGLVVPLRCTARPCDPGWSFRFAALLAHATWAGRSASLHCSPMRPGLVVPLRCTARPCILGVLRLQAIASVVIIVRAFVLGAHIKE